MDKINVGDNNSTNYFSTSTSQTKNVRTKVRSWMTDIANEMKRKSPAAVQKWVDSIPITASTSAATVSTVANVSNPDKIDVGSDIQQSTINNNKSNDGINKKLTTNEFVIEEQPEEELYEHQNYSMDTPNTSKSIKRLFKDFSVDDDDADAEDDDDDDNYLDNTNDINKISKNPNNNNNNDASSRFIKFWYKNKNDVNKITDNLTALSKNKVNEIYDKINKKKFHLNLNTKTKDLLTNIESNSSDNCDKLVKTPITPIDNRNISNKLEEPSTSSMAAIKPDETDKEEINTNLITDNNNKTNGKLNYTEFLDNLLINKNNINNIKYNQRKIGIGIIGRSISETPNRLNNKKQYLCNIGRSFSETVDNDDDDDDKNIPQSSYLINSSLINTPTTSTSQFFNNNHKYSISREHSLSDNSSRQRNHLLRDSSIQSDSSHCSSVESLLEARKPDPEAILINLGFGPEQSEDILSKIPRRFLKPSQVRGIDTEAFLRQQQLALNLHEHSVLGYRGLVGNPHIPPSTIVAKIMERFHINNERSRYLNDNDRPLSAPPVPGAETNLN